MKKNKTKGQEQKPRRLRLNRETIRVLHDPALLGLVRGGEETEYYYTCLTEDTNTGSNANTNCYATTCSNSRPGGQQN
jgi:hypothetical protein